VETSLETEQRLREEEAAAQRQLEEQARLEAEAAAKREAEERREAAAAAERERIRQVDTPTCDDGASCISNGVRHTTHTRMCVCVGGVWVCLGVEVLLGV
jgi:septal ring factor EnvC (AmiA/AmiB activator)